MVVVICLVPIAYLLGTFPSAALVAKRAGIDVTAAGSGNPGASNVTRLLGWKAGVIVFLADAGKGALAAGGGRLLDDHRGAYILGIAAVLGHVFPVTRRFKGGRGVATGAGVFLIAVPYVTVGLATAWVVIAKVLKKASVASLVCAIAFPFAVAAWGYGWGAIGVAIAVAALVVARHRSNLLRLIRGEEHSLEADEHDVDGEGHAA